MSLETNNQLSLRAHFDDYLRKFSALFTADVEDFAIALIKINHDIANELKYTENELQSYKKKCVKYEESYRTLEATLKNVRECYKKEANLRDKITRERDGLYNRLCSVRDLLKEDKLLIQSDFKARERVLSCLDLNLTKVDEVNESGGDCISDTEYDKSEEDVLELSKPNSCVQLKRGNGGDSLLSSRPNVRDHNDSGQIELAKEPNDDVTEIHMEEVEQMFQEQNKERTDNPVSNGMGPQQTSTPFLKPMKPNDISHFLSQSKLENRKHTFAQKKLLKANEQCTVCGTKIGFYSTYHRCSDCRACCHSQCKAKLPLPCIPYAPKENLGKNGRLITIADYVNPQARPCIPALIIHCCTEIEKRGLNETGLYRIPGSDKEIRALTDKILKSKTGIPILSAVDVHVLCGVVKAFFSRLDDPLITRVLWRDFVDAAKIEDHEDRRPYICQAICELPLANKQTLAYFILHLQRIAASPACNMPVSNLARVLGPTIVGYSTANATVTVALYSENPRQIRVMEALLTLPQDYWSNLISETSHPMSPSIAETINKRQSIGSRVVGGSLQSEILNPNNIPKCKRFRPLF